jgi:RNA polymerase sigma-70 factor (sigma-E family)
VSAGRDAEYTEYVSARLPTLRRLAVVLCQDWQRADDLVQATITKLYVHWGRASAADHVDAYARAVLVREFVHERRSSWARRVSLSAGVADSPAAAVDHDAALDLRTAVAALPPRQRATLVLRFYCDLDVDQSARLLGCSPGTVKSQTAKALNALRRALQPVHADDAGGRPDTGPGRRGYGEVPGRG